MQPPAPCKETAKVSHLYAPRIFDLFYTSDKREYTVRTGLAVVKELVNAWKAGTSVHSQEGEGSYTRFEILFPPLT